MRIRGVSRKGQAGFSMIEFLVAAVILAVGILGVTLMQVMSLKAARGSRSLTTATLLAERILDQVEMEGRLTWLNVSATDYTTPAALPNLVYLAAGATYPISQAYDAAGNPAATGFFSTQMNRVLVTATPTKGVGMLSDVTVTVTFTDTVGSGNTQLLRSVALTRRIVHG